MKVNDHPWTCEICGGHEPSGATQGQVSAAYGGTLLAHRDPRTCIEYLAEAKKSLPGPGTICLGDAMRRANLPETAVLDAGLGRGRLLLKSVTAWYKPNWDMVLSVGKEYTYRGVGGEEFDFVA